MNEDTLRISPKKYTGKTEVISARVPSDLVAKLNELSNTTGRSRNEIIEKCLTFAIERTHVMNGTEE